MSPCRMCREGTIALGSSTRMMWKGCARCAKRLSSFPDRSNMSYARWVRTVSIAGSRSATILCSMIREGSSDGIAIAFDIEDRKRAEAEVEQAYARLAQAQRLSKTGSFITDLLADEHNWSEELCRIFEFDPGTHSHDRRDSGGLPPRGPAGI